MSTRTPSAWSPRARSIWGVPYKADVKSTIWYPIKAFAAKGYKVPTTWDELIALSDKIVAIGTNPWCVSAGGPGTATGWQLTDWVEEVVLKTKGPTYYNDWISHKVTFQDQGIKDAFAKVGKILFTDKYVYGGNTAIVATDQKTPMDPMFTDDLKNPKCWMQKIPTWYGPDFFPDQRASGKPSKYIIGTDVGIFAFPTIDPAQNYAEGSADTLMVMVGPTRSPGGRPVPRDAGTASRTGSAPAAPSRPTRPPGRVVRRRVQAQGRCGDREQGRRYRLRRFRPHARQGRRRHLLDQTVKWANAGGSQYGRHSEGHRRQLAHPVIVSTACGARHLTVARPATISARRIGWP